jgi:hypothetical protein
LALGRVEGPPVTDGAQDFIQQTSTKDVACPAPTESASSLVTASAKR